jgi:hypothetical protein
MSSFTYNNLKNQSGAFSGIKLKLEKFFNGEFTAGLNTGANTGVVPDNVLISNYWLDNTQLCQFRLSGLNHSRRYRIGFIGSSSSNGWFKGNYTATYTVNGKTVYLNSWMNSTKIVYIHDLVPDVNGEMLLDFSTTQAAAYGFNAGIIIQEYTDKQGGSMLYMSNSVLEEENPIVTAENDLRVLTYPNPFTDLINIDFNNSSTGNKISAEVYDMYGRLVHRQNYNTIPAGRNTLRINSIHSGVRTGVFIVALKVNGKVVQTMKMLRNQK